jgi:hypothetical protein
MIGRPIKTLRRWGIGWPNIVRCMIGWHRRTWVQDGALLCGRCGRVLVKARPRPVSWDPAQGGVHPEEVEE